MKIKTSKTKLQLNLESRNEVEAFKQAIKHYMNIIYEDGDLCDGDVIMEKISDKLEK